MQRLRHVSSHESFLAIWIIGALVVFGALGYSYIASHPMGIFDGQHEGDVRTTVAGFGNALSTVSLLSPDVATQIRTAYAPYVAPELLATWEADPSRALGRDGSSAWPDHISVDTVIERTAGVYDVTGQIVFTGSADAAATIPVVLTVTRIKGAYLITHLETQSTGPLPSSMESIAVSLGQPQTALGMRLEVQELVADSRCPSSVQCIQKGSVQVRATMGYGMGSSNEALFIQGVATTFDSYVVTLAEVFPEPSTEDVPADQYIFVFRVETR